MRAYAYRLLTYVLMLGLLACLASYVYLLRQPSTEISARPVMPWSPATQNLGNLSSPVQAAQAFEQTFQRPLFFPERKPFQPTPPDQVDSQVAEPIDETPPEQPVAFDAQQLQLKGILISEKIQTALIASPEQPGGTWVKVGSNVMGWTVRRIEKSTAILELAGKSVVLKQYVDNLQQ
jgi:hypothetical protein